MTKVTTLFAGRPENKAWKQYHLYGKEHPQNDTGCLKIPYLTSAIQLFFLKLD